MDKGGRGVPRPHTGLHVVDYIIHKNGLEDEVTFVNVIIIAFISGSMAHSITHIHTHTHTQSIKHNTAVKKKLRNYSNKNTSKN